MSVKFIINNYNVPILDITNDLSTTQLAITDPKDLEAIAMFKKAANKSGIFICKPGTTNVDFMTFVAGAITFRDSADPHVFDGTAFLFGGGHQKLYYVRFSKASGILYATLTITEI